MFCDINKMQHLVIAAAFALLSVSFRASCSSLEDFVSDHLKLADSYAQDISEYTEKFRKKEAITEKDLTRYSNAYAYCAWEYHLRKDDANALKSASFAIKLSPKNPPALFVGGYICKLNGDYANAVTCFQTASNNPDEKIKTNAYIELALMPRN